MNTHQPDRQPMSGAKHFWLSFLAVLTGVPVSLIIISTFLFFISLFFILMIAASLPGSIKPSDGMNMTLVYGDNNAKNTIVAVPINGPILAGSSADPLMSIFGFSFTDGDLTKRQLRSLAEDSSVSAIVLEIDSPGGMITASKAIADGVEYYRTETGKPVIAHINGMGASGGYWVASAADKIYAEQGSEAGSVGVIMGPLVELRDVVGFSGITTREAMNFRYFSAGRSKDLGNPFRAMTVEEEAYLNNQLANEYDRFVSFVTERRSLTADKLRGEIGALSYGTVDAQRLGLIDGEMSKEQVYGEVAGLAQTGDNYKVMRLNNTADFFSSLFGVRQLISELKTTEADKSAARTRFCEQFVFDRPLVYKGDIQAICR